MAAETDVAGFFLALDPDAAFRVPLTLPGEPPGVPLGERKRRLHEAIQRAPAAERPGLGALLRDLYRHRVTG